MLLVSGNGCFQCAADHDLHGSFLKHPASIRCRAPLVLLITHDKIMVKWGQLAWPQRVWTKGEWWISSWVLIFTITTYRSMLQSKHGLKHLSLTFMDPVQLHLMATHHMKKKNYWAFFYCHSKTRPVVPYFHYVILHKSLNLNTKL